MTFRFSCNKCVNDPGAFSFLTELLAGARFRGTEAGGSVDFVGMDKYLVTDVGLYQ